MRNFLQKHWRACAGLVVGVVAIAVATRPSPTPVGTSPTPRAPAAPPALPIDNPNPSPVGALIGSAPTTGWSAAIAALGYLPPSLSATEQRVLIEFLESGMPGFRHLPPAQFHHVANELMVAILRQRQIAPQFVPVLGRIARAGERDPVVRDYALQALGRWLGDPKSVSASPGDLDPAVATLLAAAADTGEPISGTALIALEVAHLTGSSTGRGASALGARHGEFLALLDKVVGDPEAHPFARTSAIQIATRLGRPELLQHARNAAADPAQPPALRASALAAIGELGDPSADREILEICSRDTHLQVSTAGAAARRKLSRQL